MPATLITPQRMKKPGDITFGNFQAKRTDVKVKSAFGRLRLQRKHASELSNFFSIFTRVLDPSNQSETCIALYRMKDLLVYGILECDSQEDSIF